MIVHRCKQGSPEWHELRRGKPTASVFNQIVKFSRPTKQKVKPMPELSASRKPLLYKLAAERILGYCLDSDFGSAAMQAGRENEPKARALYELTHGCEVEQVGIVFPDHGRYGASPDGLVGTDGLVEIKCPEPKKQVEYLLAGGGAYEDYKLQIQGQLLVCERDWCDSVSWSYAGLATAEYRHVRDEPLIAALRDALEQFCDELDEATERLVALGCVPMEPQAVAEASGVVFNFDAWMEERIVP